MRLNPNVSDPLQAYRDRRYARVRSATTKGTRTHNAASFIPHVLDETTTLRSLASFQCRCASRSVRTLAAPCDQGFSYHRFETDVFGRQLTDAISSHNCIGSLLGDSPCERLLAQALARAATELLVSPSPELSVGVDFSPPFPRGAGLSSPPPARHAHAADYAAYDETGQVSPRARTTSTS